MSTSVAKVVPLTLSPAADESLAGYLARLAECNAYDRSSWLALEIGERSLDSTQWSESSLYRLAELTGLPFDSLAARAYIKFGGNHSFFGDRVPLMLLEQTFQKYCPDCLAERGYHSALFDLSPVWVCPLHARRLSHLCPQCAHALCWGHPGVLACPLCRADLRHAGTERIAPESLTGVAALARRAGFADCHPAVSTSSLRPPPLLAHIDLGGYAELLLGFATYAGFRTSKGSFLNTLRHEHANVHIAFAMGWEILREWPSRFRNFLGAMAIRRRQQYPSRFGVNRDFGPLFQFLSGQEREPWLTVRRIFWAFIENDWCGDIMPSRRRSFAVMDERRPARLTMAETSRRLERGFSRTRNLLLGGLVRWQRVGLSRGAPIFVEREDVDRIAPAGSPPLELSGMAKILGVSKGQASRLIEARVIGAIQGPSIDGSKTYLIPSRLLKLVFEGSGTQSLVEQNLAERIEARSARRQAKFQRPFRRPSIEFQQPARREVDTLMDDVISHITLTPRASRRLRSFSGILNGQTRLGLPLKPIVDAMRDGRLPAIKINPSLDGLSKFEFDKNDVKVLFNQLMLDSSPERGLPVALTAKRLGTSYMSALWLMRRGHLSTSVCSTPQGCGFRCLQLGILRRSGSVSEV